MGYPVMDLSRFKRSVRWYVDALEETIIKTLHHFGIEGHRTSDVGVWVGGTRKVAAIGISVSRWITMHGTYAKCSHRRRRRSILCFPSSSLFLSLSSFAKAFEKPIPLSLYLSPPLEPMVYNANAMWLTHTSSLLSSLSLALHLTPHTKWPLHLQDALED